MVQLQDQFNYEAVEEDWYGVWCGSSEELPAECRIYISNLADLVTEGMLERTFSQIGQVLGVGVERVGCGWVEFKNAEDALEVVQRFGGVELAEKAMVCGRSESVWEAQADYWPGGVIVG